MARKTQEESQKTRESILDAAELVFLNKGVSQASMADIAQEAGISRGAVYGHYKNKIELGMAMCYRALGTPDDWIVNLLPEESALSVLREQCLSYQRAFGESDSRRRVLEILYSRCERIPLHEDMLIYRDKIDRSYEEDCVFLLTKAVEQGELPADLDIQRAFHYISTLICGQCYELMGKEISPDLFLANIEPFLDASLDAMRFSPALRKKE